MDTLNCCLDHMHRQKSESVPVRPPTRRWREATLSSTGVNPNIQAPSRGAISIEESPTPLEKNGSRALAVRRGEADYIYSELLNLAHQLPTREVPFHNPRASFCSRGSDRQGPRLRLPPSSQHSRPGSGVPAGPHG